MFRDIQVPVAVPLLQDDPESNYWLKLLPLWRDPFSGSGGQFISEKICREVVTRASLILKWIKLRRSKKRKLRVTIFLTNLLPAQRGEGRNGERRGEGQEGMGRGGS